MASRLERAFTPDEENDIISTSACTRRDSDIGVTHTSPRFSLFDTEQVFRQYDPKSRLGDLKCFPPEIMHMIYRRMDLKTLMSFRHVSRQALHLVMGLREWTVVTDHASDVLHILFCTHLASLFTITGVYKALTTSKCVMCGRFGGLVFLPRLERSCLNCTSNPLFDVWHITKHNHRSMPRSTSKMYCLPGLYEPTPNGFPNSPRIEQGRQWIVAQRSYKGMKDLHGTLREIDREQVRGKAFASMRYLDQRKGTSQSVLYCRGCVQAHDPAILGRYLMTSTHQMFTITWRNVMYLTDGFLEHFRCCKHAQEIWNEEVADRERIIRTAKERARRS